MCANEGDMAALDQVFMLERAAANDHITRIVQYVHKIETEVEQKLMSNIVFETQGA